MGRDNWMIGWPWKEIKDKDLLNLIKTKEITKSWVFAEEILNIGVILQEGNCLNFERKNLKCTWHFVLL